MNKEQYMKELDRCLKGLSAEDKEDAVRFYEDYIEESGLGDSQQVEETLGTPKEVARKILGDCVEKQINRQSENAGLKNSTKTVWLILLGILASPVAFPLLLVAVILYFCMVIVICAVSFSVLACGIAGGFSGIMVFVATIWAATAGQRLVMLGIGLIRISLGIMFCLGFYQLSGMLVRLLVHIHRKIFNRYAGKKV